MVAFNQSNEVLFVWLCYGKLQSHLVPQPSPLPHEEGRVWSTEYTTAVLPHCILWPNLRTVFSHVICCRHLTTKCHSGSVENCLLEVARNMKTKEKQVLVFLRLWEERMFVALPTGKTMTKHFLRRYFSVGQRTIQWHCSGCVTTHCYHEGSGNLT